jgi:hypothetical protein
VASHASPPHRSRLVPPGPSVVGLVEIDRPDVTGTGAIVAEARARVADGAAAIYGVDARTHVPVDLEGVDLSGSSEPSEPAIPVWTGAAPTLVWRVGGDQERLGALLAQVEPHRADTSAVIVTDAVAETVRFLAVLAVLEERAEMPAYDLADPSLKWHAPAGVEAVPNPPTIVDAIGGADSGGAA